MSFCLILLAAGNSKRFGSNIPKPFVKIGKKTLLEHSLIKFDKIKEIKKTIVVLNKNHSKFIKNIKPQKFLKVNGGKSRRESTLKALQYIKKSKINYYYRPWQIRNKCRNFGPFLYIFLKQNFCVSFSRIQSVCL